MIILWFLTNSRLREEKKQNKALKADVEAIDHEKFKIEAQLEASQASVYYLRGNEVAYLDTIITERKKHFSLIRYHEKTMEGIYDMPVDSAYFKLKAWLRSD